MKIEWSLKKCIEEVGNKLWNKGKKMGKKRRWKENERIEIKEGEWNWERKKKKNKKKKRVRKKEKRKAARLWKMKKKVGRKGRKTR